MKFNFKTKLVFKNIVATEKVHAYTQQNVNNDKVLSCYLLHPMINECCEQTCITRKLW